MVSLIFSLMEDLLAVFMDNSIMNSTLKMEFINEKAIDDAGVSRDVYTASGSSSLNSVKGKRSGFQD